MLGGGRLLATALPCLVQIGCSRFPQYPGFVCIRKGRQYTRLFCVYQITDAISSIRSFAGAANCERGELLGSESFDVHAEARADDSVNFLEIAKRLYDDRIAYDALRSTMYCPYLISFSTIQKILCLNMRQIHDQNLRADTCSIVLGAKDG